MFKLKESVLKVRDQSVTVRELTHAERYQWVKIASEDRYQGPALLVSLGSIEPKFTVEEANGLPADVVATLAAEVMSLSGMSVNKKDASEKEPDA